MHDWLVTLARLACPVVMGVMGVMMWMMMRGHRRDVSLAAAPGDLGAMGATSGAEAGRLAPIPGAPDVRVMTGSPVPQRIS